MRRRTLLASTSMAAFGQVVQGLGELTELALPTSDPLPSRLGMSHVQAVRAVTERLRGVARQFGGQAGLTLVRSGHPDDALKCFQLGQFVLAGFQPGKSGPAILRADDPRIPTLAGRLNRNSATAYALMDHPEQAKRFLAEAQDGWSPRDVFAQAGMAFAIAGIELDLRRFDIAESFAACAVGTYGEGHRQGRIRPNSPSPRCTCGPGSPAG